MVVPVWAPVLTSTMMLMIEMITLRALMMIPAKARPRPFSPVLVIWVRAMMLTTRPAMLMMKARTKPTIERTLYRPVAGPRYRACCRTKVCWKTGGRFVLFG